MNFCRSLQFFNMLIFKYFLEIKKDGRRQPPSVSVMEGRFPIRERKIPSPVDGILLRGVPSP